MAPVPQHEVATGRRQTSPIGVSCIVRVGEVSFPEMTGRLSIVVGQAANGPNRYRVMLPGDPMTYSFAAADLEVVQGVDLDGWWRR